MIRSYQHVSITVSDLERSVAFYRDKLGFSLMGATSEASDQATAHALGYENVHLRLAILTQGNCTLELIQYLSPAGNPRAPRTCDVGSMHMALEVDDIHSLYRKLSAEGVEFLSPPNRNPADIAWAWWCYMRDPDGVPIELVQVAA